MAFAETAKLLVEINLAGNAARGLSGLNKQVDAFARKSSVRGGLGQIGQGIGLGIKRGAAIGAVGLAALSTQIVAGVKSLRELENVEAQTRAGLKSTNAISGQTAQSIRDLAEEYEELGGVIDDKVIQAGENILLTFTNIREDAFEPALAAALDMSTRLGTDLTSAALQLGKALQDPIKGISRLTRSGVDFTEAQKEQIANYVELGETAKAQQVILEEVNQEFGGSFAAAGKTNEATVARFQDSIEGIQQNLATAFLPAIDKVARRLNEIFSSQEFIKGARDVGNALAGFVTTENLDRLETTVRGVFGYLASIPWGVIGDGLRIAGQSAKVAVDAFRSLPPGVQNALITLLAANKLTGGLVASGLGQLAGVALSSLKTITAGHVTVVGPVGGAPTGGAPAAGGRGLGGLKTIVTNFAALAAIPLTFVAVDMLIDELSGARDLAVDLNKKVDNLPRDNADALNDSIDKLDKAIDAANQSTIGGLLGINQAVSSGLEKEKAELIRARNDLSRNIVRGTDATTRTIDRVNATMNLERSAANAYRAADAARIQSLRDSHNAALYELRQIKAKKSSFSVTVNTETNVSLSATAVALQVQRITTTNNINSPDPGSVF